MSVSAGTRLGPYEILLLIGSGGMGEVYKARDTRLDRTVAIKVLPPHLSNSPEVGERFEREARTISSLNHPNICVLHDIGKQGDVDYLVMEYLEGETLAQRLTKGPLPLDQALKCAIEIASALDKAHRQGVTHRDLKPGNIMLTKSGSKLLDFGLAKLKPSTGPVQPLSSMPTAAASADLTGHGTILGTLQYMSPEQLEGQEADARSDIFAFGAVLYEMLTGRKAFEGKSQSSLIAAIMHVDPPGVSVLQPMTPPTLDHVVRRCLAKDADERWQTAADLCVELKWVAEGGSQAGGVAAPVAVQHRGRERLARTVAALAVSLAVALAVTYLRHGTPTGAAETRTEIVTPATSDPISFALSPDGRQLVFVASGDGASRLWLRPLDKSTAQPLAGTEGASYPFWSPDGRSIGFFDGTKLKRVDIAGGSPQTLTDTVNRGGTWNPEGVILFTPTFTSPLFRIPASGGAAVAVTKLEKQSSHRFPQFLPGGRQFLFYAQGTPETQGIYLGSLDAPETKRLTAADAAGVYAATGWLFFIRGGTLLAQRLDLTRRELTGDPVTVADLVAFDSGAYASAVSVSAAGLMAYRAGGANRRQLTWFDRAGKALGTVGAPDENNLTAPRLSPNGRRVAVYRTVQGNTDIWLLDADRTTRFTFDPSFDRFPIWSPDGSQIAFDSTRKGHRDLYQKPASGAGSEELLLESGQDKVASDWSADGRFILYISFDQGQTPDLWVLPLSGANASPAPSASVIARSLKEGSSHQEMTDDRKPFVFLKTSFEERRGQFSPDGRWIAYQSNESGRYEIYVRAFPGPGGQWQISTAGGTSPRWGTGGKELFYIAADGTLMTAPIAVIGATIEPGRPAALFRTRIYGGGTDLNVGTNYDVARDGRFLINTVLDDAAAPITLLQNWKPPTK